jgi:hypothetical protein
MSLTGLSSLVWRTKVSDTYLVKGSEFLRRVQAIGQRSGTTVTFEPHRGKASHATLYSETSER